MIRQNTCLLICCIVSSTISRGLWDDGRQNDVDKPQSVTQAMSAYVACLTNDNATIRALIAPRPPNIDINESSDSPRSRDWHLNFKELCSKFRYAITYSARWRDVPLSFATKFNVWSIPHTRIRIPNYSVSKNGFPHTSLDFIHRLSVIRELSESVCMFIILINFKFMQIFILFPFYV